MPIQLSCDTAEIQATMVETHGTDILCPADVTLGPNEDDWHVNSDSSQLRHPVAAHSIQGLLPCCREHFKNSRRKSGEQRVIQPLSFSK